MNYNISYPNPFILADAAAVDDLSALSAPGSLLSACRWLWILLGLFIH